MNKKNYQLSVLAFLGLGTFTFAQQGNVGINTNDPKVTLDVVGQPAIASKADGLLAPRLTGAELFAKSASYTNEHIGTLVFITEVATGTNKAGKTANVDALGYYYFDGSVWVKVGGGAGAANDINIYAQNGQINTIRTVDITGSNKLHLKTTSTNPSSKVVIGPDASITNDGPYELLITGDTKTTGEIKTKSVIIGDRNNSGSVTQAGIFQLITSDMALGKVLTSDEYGRASWKSLPVATTYTAGTGITISGNNNQISRLTPWNVESSSTTATTVDENIYQKGRVSIGDFSTTVSDTEAAKFQISGGEQSQIGLFSSDKQSKIYLGHEEGQGLTVSVGGDKKRRLFMKYDGTFYLGSELTADTGGTGHTFVYSPIDKKLSLSGTATGNLSLETNAGAKIGSLAGQGDRPVYADSNGVLKTSGISTPWSVERTTTPATSSTNNIYQNGKIGVGNFSNSSIGGQLEVLGGGTSQLRISKNETQDKWDISSEAKGLTFTSRKNENGNDVNKRVFGVTHTGKVYIGSALTEALTDENSYATFIYDSNSKKLTLKGTDTDNISLETNAGAKIGSLAGQDDRPVYAAADGTLKIGTAITDTDTNTNIYNEDGTLSGNRTVTMGNHTLTFSGNTTSFVKNDETIALKAQENAKANYIGFYKNGGNNRTGNLGFGSSQNNDFNIQNEINDGNINISTAGNGKVKVNSLSGTGNRLVYADTNGNLKAESPIKNISGNYTLTDDDNNKYIYATGTITITIPSTLANGFSCVVIQQDAGDKKVTIAGNGVTLQSARGTKTRTQYSAIGIIKHTNNAATITGDATN